MESIKHLIYNVLCCLWNNTLYMLIICLCNKLNIPVCMINVSIFPSLPAATGVDTEYPQALVVSSRHQFFSSGRVVHIHHCKDFDDKAVSNTLYTRRV